MDVLTDERALAELAQRHRQLYSGPSMNDRLKAIVREGRHARLTAPDVRRILRTSQSVFVNTHVEVVSGHHTATYLRFESIARSPQLIGTLARDMAQWIRAAFADEPIKGIVATASAAATLAEGVADALRDTMPLRVALTPYDGETGRIGTEVVTGSIKPGEHFLALNDVTTRGNCVSKLGKVVTDNGGLLAGMMVFARRDSGQFPLMHDLASRHPFYWTTDLDMPQWEPAQCPRCRRNEPLLSWKNMPGL